MLESARTCQAAASCCFFWYTALQPLHLGAGALNKLLTSNGLMQFDPGLSIPAYSVWTPGVQHMLGMGTYPKSVPPEEAADFFPKIHLVHTADCMIRIAHSWWPIEWILKNRLSIEAAKVRLQAGHICWKLSAKRDKHWCQSLDSLVSVFFLNEALPFCPSPPLGGRGKMAELVSKVTSFSSFVIFNMIFLVVILTFVWF